MYTQSGVAWILMHILFFFRPFTHLLSIGAAALSAWIGYETFLWSDEEQIRRSTMIILACVFSGLAQYLTALVSLIITLILPGSGLQSEFPLLEHEIPGNNIFAIFIMVLSIAATCFFYDRFALKERIPEKKTRRKYCLLCSVLSGWTLFVFHMIAGTGA